MVIVSGEGVRRRSRQGVPRPKLVQFTLTLEEFDEVRQAAEWAGMARGAYAADATLAAARGVPDRTSSPLREVLGELNNGRFTTLPSPAGTVESLPAAW